MTTSCSCLKSCSLAVALSNLGLGLYILAEGSLLLNEYLTSGGVNVGFIIVYFQMASFLIFVGLLLLTGVIQANEKHISMYLLLSSLIWFIITTLAVSYMVFYNYSTTMDRTSNVTIVYDYVLSTTAKPPKEPVPVHKSIGFSIGLVLIWCGQIGVYKFHDQVIEKNVINAGERYVSSAIHHDD